VCKVIIIILLRPLYRLMGHITRQNLDEHIILQKVENKSEKQENFKLMLKIPIVLYMMIIHQRHLVLSGIPALQKGVQVLFFCGFALNMAIVMVFIWLMVVKEEKIQPVPCVPIFQYPPKVIFYDFACSLEEYCLNRESGYFKNVKFFTICFMAIATIARQCTAVKELIVWKVSILAFASSSIVSFNASNLLPNT